MPSDNGRQPTLSRRKAMKYGMTGGVMGGTALLAGCLGDNGDGGDDGQPVDEDQYPDPVDERVDERFTKSLHRGTYEMQGASWNPFDPSGEMANFDPPGLIYDPVLVHYQSHDTFQGVIAEDWEKDGDTLTVELRDDWTWHDGDPVTVHDWKTDLDIWFRISEITSPDSPVSGYIEDYEVVDDYTMRFHLRDDFTLESVLVNEIANDPIIIKEDVGDPSFGEWRDDLMDVDPESDEAATLVAEFQEWSPDIDDVVGNSPFELREITDTQFITEVYDDHPHADNVLFEEYAIEQHEDQVLAFMEEEVDGIALNLPASPDVMERLPDHYEINRDFDHLWSVLFNYGNYGFDGSPADDATHDPVTSDRRVRQAIAYAIDREEIWASVPEEYELYDLPPTFLNESYVDANDVDLEGFSTYDQDIDRAEQLMQEAGYERDGDMWVDGDGEPVDLLLLAQSGTDVQVDALDSIQHQLGENGFGLDVTLDAVDEGTYGERRFNGDFDILFDNHPVFSVLGLTYVGFVWAWFQQLNHVNYDEETFEIPAEIGNPDADGTMEINVQDQIEQLHLTGDAEHLRQLIWWYNQDLPMYGAVIAGDYGAVNAEDWYVDGPDEMLDNRVAEFNLTKLPEGDLIPRQDE